MSDHDDYLDLSEPDEQEAERERRKRLRRDVEANDLKDLLGDYRVRTLLWRTLLKCGIYTDGSHDTETLIREAGRNDVSNWLIREISQVDPSAFVKMQTEATQRLQELRDAT